MDGASQIIVACDVTEATNDTQQAAPLGQARLEPLKQATRALPRNEAGEVQAIPATLESGSDSDAAPQALEATAKERMAAKVRSPAGQALYSRRKVIVEPVCGQSKEARGFRRFLLRGLAKVRGAWRLGCLEHNLRKLWRYGRALRTV